MENGASSWIDWYVKNKHFFKHFFPQTYSTYICLHFLQVNKRSAQEGTGEITDADSRIISPQDVDQRLFCLNNNNNGGGGFGGFGGKFLVFILFFSAKRYFLLFVYREQPTQLPNM